MLNGGGNNQGVGQLKFLAVTSSQSCRHNGGFSVKVDHDEWETLEELVNRRDRRLAITRRGHQRLGKG